jgi:hypothetical protein
MNRRTKILQSFTVATTLLIGFGTSTLLVAKPASLQFQLQAESPQFWKLIDHNAR